MDFYLQVISGRKKGVIPSLLRGGLCLLSPLFFLGVEIRKLLYRAGIKKRFRPHAFTISIGNITAGGTGKTPFTIFLARELSQNRVAILTRGYMRKKKEMVLVGDESSFEDVGDEALVLKRALNQVSIYVGKDRVSSARKADEEGVEILLLDDGMQHLALERDVEIVLIDAQNPFGYGYLLPRGLLREPLSQLTRAHLIVLNRVGLVSSTAEIERSIRKITQAPIIKSDLVLSHYSDLNGKKRALQVGAKVALFCAIGNPHSFYELVRKAGFEVVSQCSLRDHEKFQEKALLAFAQEAQVRGASCILCTEKDAVKIIKSEDLPLEICVVHVELQIFEGEDLLKQVINQGI